MVTNHPPRRLLLAAAAIVFLIASISGLGPHPSGPLMSSASPPSPQLPVSSYQVFPLAYTSFYCPFYYYYCYYGPNSVVVTPFGQSAGPYDFSPTWSPDGTQVAFMNGYSGDLVVMAADASDSTNITNTVAGEWSPAWSPDGRRIAFVTNRDGQPEVYVTDPDGSNVARVTTNHGVAFGRVTWAPDSTRLAYVCSVGGSTTDICAINADGSSFVRLTDTPGAEADPAWSPDGRLILFITDYVLTVMNPDGSGTTRIRDGFVSWQPAWSADGRQIAFSSWGYGSVGQDIFAMRPDGTGVRLLANEAGEPAWAPFAVYADFSVACTGLTCTFDARHSVGAATYAWNLGDQSTGTDSVITHTYASSALLTVELTVTGAAGTSSSSRQDILVNLPPQASLDVSCDTSLTCFFVGEASDPDGSIERVEWRFGDGTGSSCGDGNCPLSVQHTYADPGTYPVTLQVIDNFDASATVSKDAIAVGTPPLHVGDLDDVTLPGQRGPWRAAVTVAVHRASHAPIKDAVVSALWNDGVSASCTTTDPTGRCTIVRTVMPPSKTVSLTVTGVALSGFIYSPEANHDPDGDSNGTAISVVRR